MMLKEYTLNKTPIKTTNNYGINDIKLCLDLDNLNISKNIEISTNENEKIDVFIDKECNNIFESKIGLSFKDYNKIKININEDIINPIFINYCFDNNETLINEIEIISKKNTSANIIFKYFSKNNIISNFHHLKQINTINENSNINITIANFINDNSKSLIAIENNIKDNAKLTYNIIDFGGKNKITNYYSKLEGNKAINNFNNIYLGNNDDIIDLNYYIEIFGKNTICNLDVQGVLNKNAKKNFKGILDFKKDSLNAIGCENENCLILSDNAKSKSLPMLLAHEDNVQGSHGVSSGKIDEEKLFYIMSKGFSKKEAEKLIIKANFNKIIQNIDDLSLQNEIIEIIDNL